MASPALFEHSQHGDAEKLRQVLQATEQLDLNAKDASGMTALAYGARNGHVDVVRELLDRGAERGEVIEHGYGMSNGEVAALLAPQGQEGQQAQNGAPVDVHGGRQLPDGTISYVGANDFQQGYAMPPHMPPNFYNGNIYPPNFATDAPPHQNPSHNDSHTGMPPPDVARVIPCRYFPNCRYGDKCAFAHPIAMGAPPPPPPPGHVLSPSMSSPPPPMQPMFYQQVPPGYPFAPYGASMHQPFLPMGPPGAMAQYGMPQPFVPQPPSQPQHASNEVPSSSATSPAPAAAEGTARQGEASSAQATSPQANGAPEGAVEAAGNASEAVRQKGDAAAVADGAAKGQDPGAGSSSEPNPAHRRQSFNSFLHHHAVPFQPLIGDMAAGSMAMPMAMGPSKGRKSGMGGMSNVAGMRDGKRSGHGGERPPCTFFAAGRCRFGNECRFPHMLPDGTDARPLQAAQRGPFAARYPQEPMQHARNASFVNGAGMNGPSPPPSAPTGPQADKRAAQRQQEQLQQQRSGDKGRAEKQNAPHSPSSGTNELQRAPSQPGSSQANGNKKQANATQAAKGGQQSNVVRSNPSKTSTQAAAANAAATRSSKKQGNKHDSQQHTAASRPHQRVPTVNDFPALSVSGPSTNATTSPQPPAAVSTFRAQNGTAAGEQEGHAHANGADNGVAASAPKVNFSAILSAPAPPKQKPSPQAAAAEAAPAPADGDSKENGEVAAKDAAANDAPTKPVSAAAALAAAPNGNGNSNGSAALPSKAAQSNGTKQANGQKPRAAPRDSNGSTHSAKSTPAPKPASTKPDGTASDDEGDFQLVDRSRSHGKRVTQNGSASKGTADGAFAAQSKAVAA